MVALPLQANIFNCSAASSSTKGERKRLAMEVKAAEKTMLSPPKVVTSGGGQRKGKDGFSSNAVV